MFDRDSINQICTSVKLLAEAISREANFSRGNEHEISTTLPSNPRERMNSTNLAPSKERQPNEGSSQQNNRSQQNAQTETLNGKGGSSRGVQAPEFDSGDSPSRKKTSRTQEAEKTVNRAIDAIMSFNNVEERSPSEKWYIGIGSLRKLSGNGDTVINRVIKSRKEEIDAHNSTHQLGQWHNARGKDALSIDEVISFAR
jgi:hypothetical protein